MTAANRVCAGTGKEFTGAIQWHMEHTVHAPVDGPVTAVSLKTALENQQGPADQHAGRVCESGITEPESWRCA